MRIIGLTACLIGGLLLAAGASADPPMKVDLDLEGRGCPLEKAVERCPIPHPTLLQHPRVHDIVAEGQKVEVAFSYCVTARGRMRNVALETSSGIPELDRRVLAAVAQWMFDPPIIDGEPVTVCGLRMGYVVEGDADS